MSTNWRQERSPHLPACPPAPEAPNIPQPEQAEAVPRVPGVHWDEAPKRAPAAGMTFGNLQPRNALLPLCPSDECTSSAPPD